MAVEMCCRYPTGAVGQDAAMVEDQWTCQHFSLANARDDRPTDLPHLLRRLAEAIEEKGINPEEILDLTLSQEITADGPWWSGTVYWSPDQTE
jgi:hypothetical protein